jgi:predicted aspartyl protease
MPGVHCQGRSEGCASESLASPQATIYVVDTLVTASMTYRFLVDTGAPVPYVTLPELLASESQVARTQRFVTLLTLAAVTGVALSHVLLPLHQTGVAVLAPSECDTCAA